MVLATALMTVLGAAPASLALPGLNGVHIDKAEANLYGELLTLELNRLGFKVMTERDVSTLLGVERQKELMGCSDNSCITEMIGALGVDGLVMGDVALLTDKYTISVKVLATKTGATLALFTGNAPSAKAVQAQLALAARAIGRQLAVAWQRPELAPPPEVQTTVSSSGPTARTFSLIPLVLGAVGLVTGIVLELLANGAYTTLQSATTVQSATSAYNQGKSFEPVGYVCIGVGAALLIAGGAMALFGGGASTTQPAVAITPYGATFGLSGALP